MIVIIRISNLSLLLVSQNACAAVGERSGRVMNKHHKGPESGCKAQESKLRSGEAAGEPDRRSVCVESRSLLDD